MGSTSLQLAAYLDALVHPSARRDALTAAKHRGFIASHLAGGACALAALPVFLALRGAPGIAEAVVFAWLLAPIGIAALLSRNGRFEAAHLLSSLTLAGLVATVGAITGGLSSFVLPWLLVMPLEAVFAGSRRTLACAAAMAVGVAAALFGAGVLGLLPPPVPLAVDETVLRLVSFLAATLYVCALAMSAGHVRATGERLTRMHEARYHLLAQNMTDVITRHARSGGVVFASPAAQALFGAAGEALLGNGLFERVHVGDRPAYLTALADAARDGASEIEFRVRRDDARARDPEFIWVEMRSRAIDGWPGENPEATGGRQVVAVTRDISDRKRNELVLDGARQAAENADLAKTRFLASMSHELRTPLNAIIGFSEILMSGDASMVPLERRADYAKLIHDSGQHLLGVVNGILDLSRIESGGFELTPESVDVRNLLAGCISMVALKAEGAGVRVITEIPLALPDVMLDKRALRQIVLNLLANAVKFTPRGGSVTVSAEMAAGALVMRVADTGIGICEADLRRLGEPFFQARSSYDRPYEGTGLGLSVVKGLAALHGGRVEIDSHVGGGTRVAVHLPLPGAATAGSRLARLAARPPHEPRPVGENRLPDDTNQPQKKRA
ncbi:MAG: Histidine protein kinase DivJ [Xanthobacteraceae bacterium]|jgi:cell cycle sensor histidine kinase DivJ|nr:Histidine protein kinase DivJ [Xanthobacteraceae bacterium]